MVCISKDTRDWLIVGLVITVGLLPVRLLFVEFVSDKWIGSFGIVSIVMIVIVVLAGKEKLGSFGKMFLRQMIRTHQGKRRVITYTIIFLTVSYLSASILLVESGNGLFPVQKQRALDALSDKGITGIESAPNMSGHYGQVSIDVSDGFVKPFVALSVTHAIINDWTAGMMLHLHTVLLIEELEIIGLIAYYGFKTKRKESVRN